MSEAIDKSFDELGKNLEKMSELTDKLLRATDRRLASLEHDARQPHLATEADVKPNTTTRKRTEDATANQAKHGDSCSAKKVEAGPTTSTSFGVTAKPPAFPRRDDVLVDKGAAAPNPCLSPVTMRKLTAPGGLLPARTAFTAVRTTFPRPLFSWSPDEETKKSTRRTNFNQLASRCWRKVVQTKSRPTMVFDPGGSTGHLRACPFFGGWRALLCGEVFVWMLRWYPRLERFWYTEDLNIIFKRGQAIRYSVHVAVDNCLREARLV